MSMSTRSSGAGGASGRQSLPDKKPDHRAESPSPESPLPPGPLTRKRAASLRTDEPRIEDLSLNTPTTSSPHQVPNDSGRDLICLCTPAPKVPRPRNAFILYRQYHQAQVVAQNPGLANPEISKIIGERWRDESDELKDQWKRLAEEEKLRHQRQYPDYRYQPRRGGKGVNARAQTPTSQGTGEDPGRCPKCGGRYIATPRTPGTPFPFMGTPSRGGTPNSSGGNNGGGTGGNMSFSHANQRVVETDHLRHPSYSGGRGEQHESRSSSRAYPTYPSSHHHHYQPPSGLHGISEEYEMAAPSEPKRRRYDSNAGYADSSSYAVVQYPYGQPYQHSALPLHVRGQQMQQTQQLAQQELARTARYPSMSGPSMLSPAYPPQRGGTLPGPPPFAGRPSIGMAPPPAPPQRPASGTYPPPPGSRRYTAGASTFDESLRLPPLQTPATTTAQQQPHSGAQAHGSSPASDGPAGPAGPVAQQRDRDSQARGVEAMIMSIPYINKLKVLEKIAPPLAPPGVGSPGVETRGPVIAIEGMLPGLVKQVGAIVERALAGSRECAVRVWSSEDKEKENIGGGGVGEKQQLGFAGYLRTIMEWHGRSEEIVKHITTSPEPVRRGSDVSMAESSGDERKSKSVSASGGDAAPSSSANTGAAAASQQGPSRQKRPLLPVALLTDGFSLTISDRFACRVPIADSYAPVDHWQWMATLWRGIVGPDLVIYVRAAEEEEMTRLQAVELQGPEIMKVRVTVPQGAGVDGLMVGEKFERRLGFEVVEWVRNGSFKEGF